VKQSAGVLKGLVDVAAIIADVAGTATAAAGPWLAME
jgi:hypothetical protein